MFNRIDINANDAMISCRRSARIHATIKLSGPVEIILKHKGLELGRSWEDLRRKIARTVLRISRMENYSDDPKEIWNGQ